MNQYTTATTQGNRYDYNKNEYNRSKKKTLIEYLEKEDLLTDEWKEVLGIKEIVIKRVVSILPICPVCKKRNPYKTKYCSTECVIKASKWKQNICIICGNYFKSPQRSKFCSNKCRQKYYREKDK